jgi:uncharacterized protein
LRAVLDPNVIISALLNPYGAPADVLRGWRDGVFEMIVSPALLEELKRALSYPKLRERIAALDAAELIDLLSRSATHASDDHSPPLHSADPNDDYLLALAAGEGAILVSGDKHLLALAGDAPIHRPSEFAELIMVKHWRPADA